MAKKPKKSKPKSPRIQEPIKRGPMHYVVAPLRRIAPLVAWAAALACQLTMPDRMDLLETVIRCGVVWIATWLLCQIGASLAERLGDLTESGAAGAPIPPQMESGDATA